MDIVDLSVVDVSKECPEVSVLRGIYKGNKLDFLSPSWNTPRSMGNVCQNPYMNYNLGNLRQGKENKWL